MGGTIARIRHSSGTLHDYLARVESPPPGRIAADDRRFDFYLLGTRDCSSHGKPLDACPAVFTVARDQVTGEVAVVTLPAGLAVLGQALIAQGQSSPAARLVETRTATTGTPGGMYGRDKHRPGFLVTLDGNAAFRRSSVSEMSRPGGVCRSKRAYSAAVGA